MKKRTSKITGGEIFCSLKGPIIYGILCTANKMIYVGQTIRPKARMADHLYELRSGIHSNRRLQNSWNKYGHLSFELLVLERLESKETLDTAEERWFARYQGRLFNILKKPGIPPIWKQDYDQSSVDESVHRKRVAQKEWDALPDSEKKARTAVVKLPTVYYKQRPMSEEKKREKAEKQKLKMKQLWTTEKRSSVGKIVVLKSPTGELVEVQGLAVFAEQSGLSYKRLSEVVNGKTLSHKGWSLPETIVENGRAIREPRPEKPEKVYQTPGRERNAKRIKELAEARKQGISLWPTLVDPTGVEHRGIVKFSQFCKEHGLSGPSMTQVVRCRGTQYLGWKIVYDNPNMDL